MAAEPTPVDKPLDKPDDQVMTLDRKTFRETVQARDQLKTEVETLRLYKQQQESAAQAAAQADLAKKGDFDKALQLERDKSAAKEKALFEKYKLERIPERARVAIASIPNILESAKDDVYDLVAPHLDINPDTHQIYVKGPDGNPLVNAETNAFMTPEEFAISRANKPHFIADNMATNTGVKTVNNNYRPTTGKKWEEMSRKEHGELEQNNPKLAQQLYLESIDRAKQRNPESPEGKVEMSWRGH